MKITLNKKPKNVTIIEGFPGFGLIGTISSEFLMEHLKFEKIGKVIIDENPAMIAIHENKVVEPIGIFYNKQYNLVIMHAIAASTGLEWKLADMILGIASQLGAKEIISLEGVGSGDGDKLNTNKVFYFTNTESLKKRYEKVGLQPLKEGIVIGVTGALLVSGDKQKVSSIFAETHTQLPDSKAAAKVVEVLGKIVGFKVDAQPLLAQAEKFEDKLKGIISKGQQAKEMSDAKRLSYVG